MLPTWGRQDPIGPHVGHANRAICVVSNPCDDFVHRHQDVKRSVIDRGINICIIKINQKRYYEAKDDIVSDTILFMCLLYNFV